MNNFRNLLSFIFIFMDQMHKLKMLKPSHENLTSCFGPFVKLFYYARVKKLWKINVVAFHTRHILQSQRAFNKIT